MFDSINAGSELSEIIGNIHNRRHLDVMNWITADSEISEQIKQNADAIAGQFCASGIGIVYAWLANPGDLEATCELHENLKKTMILLLSMATHTQFKPET